MKPMLKVCLAVLAGVSCAGTRPTQAGGPPISVCRQRDVLDVAAQRIAERGLYARLMRDSVSETPTLTPDLVMCTATVKVSHFDTPRFGQRPDVALEVTRFTVKRLNGGFEVGIP